MIRESVNGSQLMVAPISNDESTSGNMKKLMVKWVIFWTNERLDERRIKKVEGEFPIHHCAGVSCHAFWKFTTLDPSKVLSKGPFARFFRGSPVIIIIHTVRRQPLIFDGFWNSIVTPPTCCLTYSLFHSIEILWTKFHYGRFAIT